MVHRGGERPPASERLERRYHPATAYVDDLGLRGENVTDRDVRVH